VPFIESGADRAWDENELPEGSVLLNLPVVKPDVVVPVVEIFLK
jgi:hypothetical protein